MSGVAWAEGPAGIGAGELFRPVEAREGLVPQDGREVVRWRYVATDLAALPGAGEEATLNLFPGQDVRVKIDRVEGAYGGGVVYVGRIVGVEKSSVVLSRVEDALVGDIYDYETGTVFQVRHAGQGVTALRLVDESQLDPCGQGEGHALPLTEEGQRAVREAEMGQVGLEGGPDGSPTVIDVLTVYTPVARNLAGGTNGITAAMNSWVTQTNQSYTNSQINQVIRLVHLAETAYTEAQPNGYATDLNRLTSNGDGFMDEVHSLRNTYGADLVHLVSNSSGVCGVAWIYSGGSAQGFGLTVFGCGWSTYAHELGHNQGCSHDHQNASSGVFCYSFGWRSTNNQWRTIMSYAPGTRINYFSNPNLNVNLNGTMYTIGIPENPGCSQGTAADNSRSMNNLRVSVSNFRPTQVGLDPPGPFNLSSPANNAIGQPRNPTLQWTQSSNVQMYNISVSVNDDLSDPIYQSSQPQQTALMPNNILNWGTTYYWGVTASNLGGQTASTPISYRFRVRPYGDVSGDGTVNFADLNIVLSQFGQTGMGLQGDVNEDGVVNFADLNVVLSNFGQM